MTALRTAFSRESSSKVYVTHRLKQDTQLVASLIRHANAVIYVCGDTRMAKDVEATILEILSATYDGESDSSEDEAAPTQPQPSRRQRAVAELEMLKSKKRYLQDIWS